MADGPRRWPLTRAKHELCSFLEHQLRIGGENADQLPAIGGTHRRSCQRALADEIRLDLADRPARPTSSAVAVPSVSWPMMM